jgi:hypothetical protein
MSSQVSLFIVLLLAIFSGSQARRGRDFVEGGEVKPGKTILMIPNQTELHY